jgi:DNA-binding NarL/FixJ family response regulator
MTPESPDFSKYRFLIADDRAFLRSVIQSILVRCRARDIKHAANGIEAMKVLTAARGSIDCVLCDWNMAPLDGLTLLRTIRAGDVRHTPRDTRVLMLTGYSDEKVVNVAIAMGANGYIVKPASMDTVVGAINNAFSRPVTLKSPESYRAMKVVDLPNTVEDDSKGVSPWILWSRMRGRSRSEMTKNLDLIRLEGEALSKEQAESRRAMKNIQKMNLSNVVPGQILAEDLFDEDGRLLLVSGTKLNESLLQRLKALVDGEEAQVMIGEFVA